MKERANRFARVYGVYPCTGGFTFAVVEARARLVDWGKIDLGIDTDKEFYKRLHKELERVRPWAIALEARESTKREKKARGRVVLARRAARHLESQVFSVTRAMVRVSVGLPQTATRHHIAEEICRVFPEIRHRLPERSIWRRDPRIHIFAALSLALAAILSRT